MSYRKKTEEILNESDKVFNSCWETLCALKEVRLTDSFVDSIFNFQIDLAKFLVKVEKLRIDIKKEEKRIVRNKNRYKHSWFIAKLRTLAKYRKALFSLNILGKSLGDAFAWWFYRFDLELLNNHSDHERTLHPPLGIGGVGELEFIERFRHIEEKFVIYHGITNILRIGDVSFFDFKTSHILSIGEIKTKESGADKIDINLLMFGPKNRRFLDLESDNKKRRKLKYFDEERLDRQVGSMIKALEVYQSPEPPIEKIEEKYYTKSIEDLYKISNSSKLSYLQASEGMLFSGIKTKSKNNKYKYLDGKTFKLNEKGRNEGANYLKKTFKNGTKYNSLIYSSIQYNEKGLNNFTRGSIPLFWMTINKQILKEIYFYEFQVFSLFNPVHLIEKIINQGIYVESHYYKYDQLNEKFKKPYIKLELFDLFIPYIVNHLQTEDSVISILDYIKKSQLKLDLKSRKKIEIRMQQMIYEYMIKPSR